MIKLLYIILLFCSPAFACIVPVSSHIIHAPKKQLKHYDFVVYAELTKFIDNTDKQQTVEFTINKVFKGPEINSVVVNNYFSNSCSVALLDKKSNYYLFLNEDVSTGHYSIDSGTFVQVQNENDYELNTKLSAP